MVRTPGQSYGILVMVAQPYCRNVSAHILDCAAPQHIEWSFSLLSMHAYYPYPERLWALLVQILTRTSLSNFTMSHILNLIHPTSLNSTSPSTARITPTIINTPQPEVYGCRQYNQLGISTHFDMPEQVACAHGAPSQSHTSTLLIAAISPQPMTSSAYKPWISLANLYNNQHPSKCPEVIIICLDLKDNWTTIRVWRIGCRMTCLPNHSQRAIYPRSGETAHEWV